jgi:hypothetical protein
MLVSSARGDTIDLLVYFGDFQPSVDYAYPYVYAEQKHLRFFITKTLLANLEGSCTKLYMFTPRYNLFHHLGTNQIGRGHVDLLITVLSIKFLQKGYSLVHSACVAKDGLGVLLIALICSGFPCFIAVKARSSMTIMHSNACVRMFLRPLTLWFSKRWFQNI